MKTKLPLFIALAVCVSTTVSAQTLATWDSPVQVTAAAGSLTKSSGCDGCADSGAHSTAQLTSGDGYAEFVAPSLSRLFAGLGADLSAPTSSCPVAFSPRPSPSGRFDSPG